MSSNVGARMGGQDCMTCSATSAERSQEGQERVISDDTSELPLYGSQCLARLRLVDEVYGEVDVGRLKACVTEPEGHGGEINAGRSQLQSRGRPHDRRRHLLGTKAGAHHGRLVHGSLEEGIDPIACAGSSPGIGQSGSSACAVQRRTPRVSGATGVRPEGHRALRAALALEVEAGCGATADVIAVHGGHV